jgi:hypothetical protein
MSTPTNEEIEKEFKFHSGDKVILSGCEWTVINHYRKFSFDEVPVQYFYTLKAAIGPYESLTIKDVNEPSWKTAEKSGFKLLEIKMYKDIDDEQEELYRFYSANRG